MLRTGPETISNAFFKSGQIRLTSNRLDSQDPSCLSTSPLCMKSTSLPNWAVLKAFITPLAR